MTDVLLTTWSGMPEGEPGHVVLDAALAARDIDARWAVWDDPSVDWAAADLVAVRATWDYVARLPEFLGWAEQVARSSRLLNDVETFAWNTDKRYLVGLASRVPVVPTVVVDDAADLADACAAYAGDVVVKPCVGAGGRGLVVVRREADLASVGEGPWVVQPLIESVRDEGEQSVFVIDGVVTCQVGKVAVGDEVRVHEEFGGINRPVPLTAEAADVALACVAAAGSLLGRSLDYARVDLLRLADETLAVSELEVTEPGLYLDVVETNAEPFAQLVADRLGRDH